MFGLVFFFNDTATTEIYTLSLHDALPIYGRRQLHQAVIEEGHTGLDGVGHAHAVLGPENAGEHVVVIVEQHAVDEVIGIAAIQGAAKGIQRVVIPHCLPEALRKKPRQPPRMETADDLE